MSRKARRLAERAVDRAMASAPLVTKSAGTREALVSAALPSAELLCKAQRIGKRSKRQAGQMAELIARMQTVLDRDKMALETVERQFKMVTDPASFMLAKADATLYRNAFSSTNQ